MLITLTTDFGTSDHYVGTMKGVILSRCPAAQIVDISHGVRKFSIWEGAYTIAQAAPFFPPGTIHVVVVDPGVGTHRKAILAQARSQTFIAPDNGVLSFVLNGGPVRELSNRALFLDNVSSTFHGRDIFAAVAGAVAAGANPQEIGPALPNSVLLEGLAPQQIETGCWGARVLSVDDFGNIITNIPSGAFRTAAIETTRGIISRHYQTFAQGQPGEVFLYAGSSGFLEIGVNQGNAADALRLVPGDPLRFTC